MYNVEILDFSVAHINGVTNTSQAIGNMTDNRGGAFIFMSIDHVSSIIQRKRRLQEVTFA